MIPIMMIFWYLFPILLLLACKLIITTFSLEQKFGIKAPDLATPFLFIGLHILSKEVLRVSFLPYLIISILLLGIVIAIGQAYYYDEINYGRYFKMYWRFIFLFCVAAYVVFVILSIASYIS